MSANIRFGTDGWRGIIAADFTYDSVRTCAQAIATYVLRAANKTMPSLVLGYDTRFQAEGFASAVAEVLTANRVRVHLCTEPTPTPAIAYATANLDTDGAVIVTASHNPAEWSGIKFKSASGGSASPEVVARIELNLSAIAAGRRKVKQMPLAEAIDAGLVTVAPAREMYLQRLAELVDLDAIRAAGLTVAVDSMYGAGSGYYQELLAGGKTRVVALHQERNPHFPGLKQPEPTEENLQELAALVVRKKCAVGLAGDGDADRLGVVSELGQYVNAGAVYALLAEYLLEDKGWRGPLVRAVNTTVMADRLAAKYGVPLHETAIGFKHIGPRMVETDAIFGGEESGSFAYRGHIPERDGILSGLLLLEMMVKRRLAPSALLERLFSIVGEHHYQRIDLPFAPEHAEIVSQVMEYAPSRFAGVKVSSINRLDGVKYLLADSSWLLIRLSNTEPLLRLYAEADGVERVNELLAAGLGLLQTCSSRGEE